MLTIHNPPNPREGDFCHGVEGEISVDAAMVCDRPGDCGCDRSHPGLNTLRASTTLMVRDIELSYEDLVTACTAVCESCHVIKTAAEKLTGIRASAARRRARRHLPVKPHPGEMR